MNNQPYGKITMYERIFNHEYNIGFFVPKKDQCAFCESYNNADVDKQHAMEDQKQQHDKEKVLSRQEKENDKEHAQKKLCKVACFDLQAVLPSPCGEVSDYYYKSKLATYNLSFFNFGNRNGHCFMWHEGIANRGANEIGTCVLNFILNDFDGSGDIILYSDNCSGQNKNKFLASLFLYIVRKYDVASITHKFLIVGHTQNEVDSIHSVIEKEKKRALRSGPVYIPAQWYQLVRMAKKKGTPYKVTEMSTNDFVDLKDLCLQLGTNFSIDEDGNQVPWKDIKILRVEKASPDIIKVKTSFSDETYRNIYVKKRQSRARSSAPALAPEIRKAYKAPPKISHKKKDGLIDLCKRDLIKSQYHAFYNSLLADEDVNDCK